MAIYEHVYGATLSMGNSEDKNSYILAYNSGLEQDMKFKLSPLSFSQSKDYSCIPFMCFLHNFNFSWKSLLVVVVGISHENLNFIELLFQKIR